MKLAVVLVNYNGKEYNETCIESILRNGYGGELRIIVVDNASTDDSVRLLRERYEEAGTVELLLLDDNYGFSYANNAGIRRAADWGAEHVVLLNNDTEIAPGMLSELAACAKRHPVSVIVPKILYDSDRSRIWSAGGEMSRVIRKARHIGLNQTDRGQYEREREIEAAAGCCLFLPMEVIRRAGMLDERFFLYYEDTEYCFRLREHGLRLYYCPRAFMYHRVGASTRGADSPLCAYYIARNWLLCSRLHLRGRYPLFVLYYILNRAACCAWWLAKGRGELVRATWRGIADYGKGNFGRSVYYR